MAFFASGFIRAQVGLQGVTIETYYVANAADVGYSDPLSADPLPAGSKTYRMYVDLAPGWELQAIFGATNIGTGEVDTMVFRSTQNFWNHTVLGKLYGYQTNVNDLDNHLIALDSWLSTGRSSGAGAAGLAASRACVLEVLPSEDTNGAAPVHPHTPATLLLHNDAAAGLPLTSEDGNIPYPVGPHPGVCAWTATPGIEALLEPLNQFIDPATQIVVTDGALGVTDTLVGPNSANRICIGQFTTAGVFSGQINLQIRNTLSLAVETYVAATPAPGQFTHSSLVWGPNALPTVTITTPTPAQNFAASVNVPISATAIDGDGTITQVQFFLDGAPLGAPIPAPGPYNTSFTTGLVTTTHQIVASGTDNDGGVSSDTVNISVTGNNPPNVVLTAPSSAITGTTVNVSATATDSDGTVASVQFFFNGAAISPVIPAPGPYVASFTATPAGTYTGLNGIRAVALDNAGASGAASQNITITNNAAPTVSISSPLAGAFVPQGPVLISANAGDTDGSVTQVEFFVNGLSIGVDNTGPSPFTFSWNAVFVGPFGANTLTAVATDNLMLTGNSAPVAVNVINPLGSPYVLGSVNQECNEPTVCIPIKAVSGIADVIGFDVVLEWDNTAVYPTGNVIKSGDIVNPNLFETDNSIDFVNEEMLVSVFLDVDAPFGTDFTGTGDIVCVEFAKRPAFLSVDTTTITVTSMQESYFNGVQQQDPVPPATFTTFRNTVMTSNIVFWEDQSAIGNDGSNVSPTIQANTAIDCSLPSAANPAALSGPVILPDVNGVFTYDLVNGVKFSIGKAIASSTDVQEVINGFDALLTRRVIIDDASFTPNIFQAIAMDVNRDGVISAGDVSQINQRAVFIIDEFRQQWNYNADGSPKPTYSASKDWQFIDNSAIGLNPSYQISSQFPQDNGVGYSKFRVPQVPFCLTAPVTQFATCPVIADETYTGILYGDVNGNWKNTSDVLLRTSDAVEVGVGQAHYSENFVDVPVTFTALDDVNSIDLNLDYDASKLSYHSLLAGDMQAVGYFNENDGKLRITSNSLDVLTEGQVAFMIRFTSLTEDNIEVEDFNAAVGYLNGDKVNVNLVSPGTTTPTGDDVYFNVYPNPTSEYLYIGISKDVTAEVVDMNGRVLMSGISVAANNKQRLDVSQLPSGVYTVRVFGDDYTSAQRVFIGN